MKRTTKPPMPSPPPQPRERSVMERHASPFKVPAVPAPPSSGRLRDQRQPPPRAPELTLSSVPTPAIEWEPAGIDALPTPERGFPPSSGATPAAAPAPNPMESSLRDQMWTGLNARAPDPPARPATPAPYSQHTPTPASSGSLSGSGTGSYPSASGERHIALPGPPPAPTIPLGYVVLSAFFLAIAVVGFGVYLAFEVISL